MLCRRCDKVLRRVRQNPLSNALACALTGLIFYVIALVAPFLYVALYGRFRYSGLSTGPMTLDDQGFWLLAAVVLLTTVLTPLVKLLCTLYVLVGLRLRRVPPSIVEVFTWLKHVGPWAMVDVYLLGFLVAFTRLQAIMFVQVGVGVYALAGLMLAMVATEAALDPEAVWEEMQRRGVIDLPAKYPDSSSAVGHLIGCETCHQVSYASEGQD
ncbi:MAG: paraquat-inducible protein A, partial [Pseudomonadota bacterium]|nr:paraquat-inducible protein A [Pseudomonadota bacterium]